MPPAPIDFAEYARLRRRAWWATLGVAVGLTPLVRKCLIAAAEHDPVGVVPFAVLAALLVPAFVVLRRVWRASGAARPVVQTLDPTRGEILGLPELDVPSAQHRTFSGEQKPPVRW